MPKSNQSFHKPHNHPTPPTDVKDPLRAKVETLAAQDAASPGASVEPETFDKSEAVPIYRRCPLCWDRCKGMGVSYSKQGRTRYYKCRKTLTEHPPCGHTWTATVTTEVTKFEIRHQRVTMDGQS